MKLLQTILLSVAATVASAISIPVEATQTTETTKLPLKIRYLEPSTTDNDSPLIVKRDCISGSTYFRECFTSLGKIPYQSINADDLRALGNRLRNLSHSWLVQNEVVTVTLEKTVVNETCGQQFLMQQGSVMLYLVHLDPTIRTNVMVKDIAATLDGVYQDVETKQLQQNTGLTECGNAGGQQGANLDPGAGYYHSPEYLALNFTPYGMIVRILSSTLN